MRPLSEEYPYLVFDARYEKVRRGGSVVSQGVLVAIGISAAGYREVLGCWIAESESEASWGAVFLGTNWRRRTSAPICNRRPGKRRGDTSPNAASRRRRWSISDWATLTARGARWCAFSSSADFR